MLLEADQAANNRELQLMAVAGMSFYAASGDDGSSDCRRSLGINGPEVDDPAVQPYATGVGGTNLDASPGAHRDACGAATAPPTAAVAAACRSRSRCRAGRRGRA